MIFREDSSIEVLIYRRHFLLKLAPEIQLRIYHLSNALRHVFSSSTTSIAGA